jgi:hypothetical protein
MSFTRERISIGEAANDGKGTDLNVAGKLLEDFMTQLCLFLTGSTSEVLIPNVLPTSRGGTGATTTQEHINYLRFYGANSFAFASNKYQPIALISIENGSNGTVKPLTNLSNAIQVDKPNTGQYVFELVNKDFAVSNGKGTVIPDALGNQLFGYELNQNGSLLSVNTYALKFDNTTGIYSLDKTKPIDIPVGNSLLLTIVNQLSVVGL